MALSTLKSRLGVARALLTNASGDAAVALSRSQAGAFLEVLSQVPNISAVDRAAFVQFSSQTCWQQSDANAVMHALTPSEHSLKSCGNRRWMQNYTSFMVYITDSMWTLLLDPNVVQTAPSVSQTDEKTISGNQSKHHPASRPAHRAPNRSSLPKTIATRFVQCCF